MSGPAAAALGDLARERWLRATGHQLEAPPTPAVHGTQAEPDPWPAHIPPDIEQVAFGIARTEPEYGERAEVREVEQLLLDAIEAKGREPVRRAIAAFRNRLLGEHLGVEPAQVEQTLAREGSLIRAIESLRGPGRSMRPLVLQVTLDMDALVPDEEIVDPERPFQTGELVKEFVPEAEQEPTRRHLYTIISILVTIVALAAAWHWLPLRELVDVPMLVSAATEFGRYPAAASDHLPLKAEIDI